MGAESDAVVRLDRSAEAEGFGEVLVSFADVWAVDCALDLRQVSNQVPSSRGFIEHFII